MKEGGDLKVSDSRERWSSRTLFIFAAIGSAVGLGNLWRYPYLAYKYGGGAFLLPYLIALFIVGIPLLILEFSIGQRFQKGAVGSFHSLHPKARGVGVLSVYCSFLVVSFYAAIMSWSLLYFYSSFKSPLPWGTDPSGFFRGRILELSSSIETGGALVWPLVFGLVLVWVMIYFSIWKGVKSVGKVVALTMPLPILFLFVLLIRGLTLEGAWEGIYYYLTPNFSALLDMEIWLAATTQIFFSIGVGFGIMIAYASYNSKKGGVVKNAYITALANSGISIVAGFVVFSVLGYMAMKYGVPVDEVVRSGPDLAFIAFPEALSMMPWSNVFSIIFFVMLLSLGIDSAFSLVEAVTATLSDKWPLGKPFIAASVCLAGFLLGLLFVTQKGLYLLDIFDHYISTYGLTIAGISECLVVVFVYGLKKQRDWINEVSAWHVGKGWSACIYFVIPVLLTVLLVKSFIQELFTPYGGYPAWATSLGWGLVLLPVLIALFLIRSEKRSSEPF